MVGASAVGAVAQGAAASKASKAQQQAAAEDIAFQRETRDDTVRRVDPFYQGGTAAHQAYLYEMGLGPRPTVGGMAPQIEVIQGTGGGGGQNAWAARNPDGSINNQLSAVNMFMPGLGLQLGSLPMGGRAGGTGTQYRVNGQTFNSMEEAQAWARANPTGGQAYRGFTATPGYQFRVSEGTRAVNAMAGARGGVQSGRTMQDLTRFGQGIAAEEYGNFMNRLAGLSDQGMGAATLQANAGQNAAAGVSNALAARGNAQAAGAVGMGNAISGGINNALGSWAYMRNLGA
jgi:hypothetical protein